MAAADLGGSVLTGTLGNPLGLLERKLSYTLHKVRDQCPLYRANGNPVDEYLDTKVEVAYNSLFNKANKLRQEVFSGLEAQIHNHTTQWFRPNVVITRIFKPGGSEIPLEGPISYLPVA